MSPTREPRSTTRRVLTVAIAVLVPLLAWLDYVTGDLALSLLYLVPIVIAALWLGPMPTGMVVASCAVAWLLADLPGHLQVHPVKLVWNGFTTLVIFGFVGATVARGRRELRRGRVSLHQSELRARRLFDTVRLIVLGLDSSGKVEYVNPYFLEITGYTPDEVLGQPWVERFLPEAQRPKLHEVFVEVLQEGHPHFQNPIVTKAGPERLIAWHNTALRDEHGRPTGSLSLGEDITDRTRLEAQYLQSQKMEVVGRLAGGVAHDFNNLLTVIIGEVELLQEDGAPPDTLVSLAEIKKAGLRAAVLTRQLLAFSRRQLIEPIVFSLNATVTEMGSMLQRLIGEDVELVLCLAADLGPICADPGQIEQVVMNLAVNARDAMPAGGTLTLATRNITVVAGAEPDLAAGEYALVTVIDTGVGMTDAVKARLFEPFFTTKDRGKGTGLGLATSYGIVKQSGGRISVCSEVGVGTTFKVYLPRITDQVAAQPAPTVALHGGTETILLVEDEETVRSIAVRFLQGQGYRVLEARDGEEGLSLSASHQGEIHLLLTDVVLPRIGGRELAERIQETRPAIKVLFASGYTDDVILQHRLQQRDIALLPKPFTRESMAKKVREVLDGQRR